ncbi:MAG: HepT-like ribonuclease domain-containing protein [Candidatus Helarchaeota archaeon]
MLEARKTRYQEKLSNLRKYYQLLKRWLKESTLTIINRDLFDALKELNGLRNRIVHDYNGLIDEIVWNSISQNLIYIESFVEAINSWLQKR